MQMLDSKGGSTNTGDAPSFEKSSANAATTPEAAPALDSFDDDIPF
jgi:hypothetical protein